MSSSVFSFVLVKCVFGSFAVLEMDKKSLCNRGSGLAEITEAFETTSSVNFSTVVIFFDICVFFLVLEAVPGPDDNDSFEPT